LEFVWQYVNHYYKKVIEAVFGFLRSGNFRQGNKNRHFFLQYPIKYWSL